MISEQQITNFLRRHLRFKDIGWAEIGERFTRYALIKTRWFNVYLHQLYAPAWHPDCHDHPWSFVALLLWRGYDEKVGETVHRRRVGSVLWRQSTFSHNVITPYGTSWSLIITGAGGRAWGFKPCEWQHTGAGTPYQEYVAAHTLEQA